MLYFVLVIGIAMMMMMMIIIIIIEKYRFTNTDSKACDENYQQDGYNLLLAEVHRINILLLQNYLERQLPQRHWVKLELEV